jgi:AraC-like DNA-binding protein
MGEDEDAMPNAALAHAPEPAMSNICNNLLNTVLVREVKSPIHDAASQLHDLPKDFETDDEADDTSNPVFGTSFAQGGLAPWQCRAIQYRIDTTFTGPVRIEELAGLARLSTSHFSRAFKISFGETPYAYVIGKRLQRAQILMLSTDEPLSRIALDCGLSDQAHLSNLFRKFMGTAPNAWRQHNRKAQGHVFAVGEVCG